MLKLMSTSTLGLIGITIANDMTWVTNYRNKTNRILAFFRRMCIIAASQPKLKHTKLLCTFTSSMLGSSVQINRSCNSQTLSFKFSRRVKISSPGDLKESCGLQSDCLQTMLATTQLEYVRRVVS